MLTRRQLLATTALLPLAACAGQSAAQIAGQAAKDIQLIGAGLAGALPSLQASGAVSASAIAQVSSAIAQIGVIASAVTGASTQAQGQTAIQQIETLLNTVVSALAGLPLPPPFGPALNAASALLPVIEIAVGLATTAFTSARPVPSSPMPPDQARSILLSASTVRM